MLRKVAKLPLSHIIHLALWYCDGGVSIYREGIYYNLLWHKSLTQWIQSPIRACVLFWQSAILGCMESIICFTVDNSLVMVDRRCLRTSLFKAEKPDEIELMSMFTKALSWFMFVLGKQHLAIGKITYFHAFFLFTSRRLYQNKIFRVFFFTCDYYYDFERINFSLLIYVSNC